MNSVFLMLKCIQILILLLIIFISIGVNELKINKKISQD